jgi:hypothetical protein
VAKESVTESVLGSVINADPYGTGVLVALESCETEAGEPTTMIVTVTISDSTPEAGEAVVSGSRESVTVFGNGTEPDDLIDRGGGDEGVTVMVPVKAVGRPDSGERVYVTA